MPSMEVKRILDIPSPKGYIGLWIKADYTAVIFLSIWPLAISVPGLSQEFASHIDEGSNQDLLWGSTF